MFLGRNRAKLLGPSGPGRQGCLFCWGPSVGSLAVPRLSPLTVTAVKRATTLSFAGKSRPRPQLLVFGHPPCMVITAGPLTFCPGASSSGGLGLRNVWHLLSTREGRREGSQPGFCATESSVFPLSCSNQPLSHPPASRGRPQIHFHASSPSPPHGLHFIQ